MVYNLRISQQADVDTLNAIDYYDQISPLLGNRFIRELNEAYQKIKNNPEYYSYISTNPKDKFRDIKLPSFPYLVIFEIFQTEVIINTVLNTHKKPFAPPV